MGRAATPFFLPTENGERFCLYHPPADECRGALLYVHPFAEEMNRSRRMAALQARALAARGIGILQLDLHGCGDSEGEFADARWDIWKQDLANGCNWLEHELGRAPGLWGLRLGATLALDYTRSSPRPVERLMLWQPVTNGRTFLTQFLRLRLAADLQNQDEKGGGTSALRAELAAGKPLEIAGYTLAAELAMAIDSLDLATKSPACPTDWFDVVAAPDRPMPPASVKIAAQWSMCTTHAVTGPSFWSTQETTEAPALIDATCAVLA